MVSNILQKLAAVGAISLCAVSSVSAGLFCNMECCRPPRPYYSPACEPAWGYHQACWRRFPALEPCSGWGDYCPSCQTDGGVVNAGGYLSQGMQPSPTMQHPTAPPVIQASPTVIQPPMQSFNVPIQPAPSYATPSYGTQMQPMPSYDAPLNAPSQSPPSSLTPQAQPQEALPEGGAMPPLPDSARIQQTPNIYRSASQTNWLPRNQMRRGVQPSFTPPQSLPPASSTQGLPIRGVSFSRVRPTTTAAAPVAAPKRSLLSRLLPGGK